MCAALLALVHGGAALLVPVPPSAPLVRAVAVAPAAASAVSYPSPFPASSVTLTIASEEAPVKKVSAAKAKIEAAKLAQQEKLASRGYGELGASCAGDGCRGNLAKPKASESAAPKTFAEQLDFAVKQRESITGTLTEEDYAKVEKRVRPLATACILPSIPVPSLYE